MVVVVRVLCWTTAGVVVGTVVIVLKYMIVSDENKTR